MTLPWTGERFLPQISGEIANEHLHRYSIAMELARDKAVLDIACGEGYGSNLLAQVAKVVIGVDVDQQAVEHARRTYPASNLAFQVGSCSEIPVPDHSIDLVVSFETIEHHDRHLEMMAEIRRVLRGNGLLLISSPDKRIYTDLPGYHNPYHVRELYRDELERLLKPFFINISLYGQRMCYGSVIAPLADDCETSFRSYFGGCSETSESVGLSAARYLIALASDAYPLPRLPSSIFELNEHSEVNALLEAPVSAHALPADGAGAAENSQLLAATTAVRALPSNEGAINLQCIIREQAEVIERISSCLDDNGAGDVQARLHAVRNDIWYWRTRRSIRETADAAIPVGASVGVLSRGDPRLLELGDRQAMHFPQGPQAAYLGRHPNDDAEAVELLEQARAAGTQYLLIPWYDRWILDDYPAFKQHVEERYRVVESRPDVCVIYALSNNG